MEVAISVLTNKLVGEDAAQRKINVPGNQHVKKELTHFVAYVKVAFNQEESNVCALGVLNTVIKCLQCVINNLKS